MYRFWIRLPLTLLLALTLICITISCWQNPRVYAEGVITISSCDENALQDAIATAPGGTIINYGLSCTVFLSRTLDITRDLFLNSDRNQVTLDGQGQVQVLHVESGVTFTLHNMTITHGFADVGGGFNNAGTTNVSYSVVTDNNAAIAGGGIYNTGTLNIEGVIFSHNSTDQYGGAIDNEMGRVTIDASSIDHNAGVGATLNNYNGLMNISASSIINNKNDHAMGAVLVNYFKAQGSATNSAVSVSNSTFAHNSGTRELIYTLNGSVNVSNSTLADNTFTEGTFVSAGSGNTTIASSILARNQGANCTGNISNGGANIEDTNTCGFSTSSDRTNIDPRLAATLAPNGGPTLTLALLPGSPAIGLQQHYCPDNDQRGLPRPLTNCDSGAYQTQ